LEIAANAALSVAAFPGTISLQPLRNTAPASGMVIPLLRHFTESSQHALRCRRFAPASNSNHCRCNSKPSRKPYPADGQIQCEATHIFSFAFTADTSESELVFILFTIALIISIRIFAQT
jgi:hypothetical protein